LLPISHAQAQARIVDIKATVSGCTSKSRACDYGAEHMPPGSTFRLIHLVNVKLKAGTYRISHAGEKGRYKGWRFNADSNWVWNFGIAINKGGSTGQLLYVALGGGNYTSPNNGVFTSLDAVVSSKGPVYGGHGGPNKALPRLAKSGGPAAFADTITLPAAATLSFFILDYDVSDNAGGVSLIIEPMSDH
jgi:hypothetical protein